jgi:hypothetical protein
VNVQAFVAPGKKIYQRCSAEPKTAGIQFSTEYAILKLVAEKRSFAIRQLF